MAFYVNQEVFLLLTKFRFISKSDHKPLMKIFTGNTDNEKCNTWDLEGTAIPRCVKVQHIKGIANILADSVSRLRAVGLYHDLDFKKVNRNLEYHSSPCPLLSNQPIPP